MKADLHILVVPDSPDDAMTVEHPPGCPQHGHIEPVRSTVDGGYECPFEEHARETGLEKTFYREDYAVPLFNGGMFPVRPGRHPVEIGLRIAAAQLTAHHTDCSCRGAVESPLTCEFCKNAPATSLLVVDWPTERVKHLACGGCADTAPGDLGRLNLLHTRFKIEPEAAS